MHSRSRVERRLVRAVWRWQGQVARRLGAQGPLRGAAVGFTQYFGAALQVTPHLHMLMPEGLWDAQAHFVALPAPSVDEVAAVLRRLLHQVAKDFAELEEQWPEDGLEALWTAGVQHRLPLDEEAARRRAGRRVALLEGFSLHADTHVHAHDRAGIERLCRYGSRGPLALERLSTREDGRYEYRTRKGQVLVFTAAQLVKRLLALIPPRGSHLTGFHGVLAPNARLRPLVIRPQQPGQAEDPPRVLRTTASTMEKKRPRLDWASLQRRTFEEDVWRCPCGGRRRVLAVVTSRGTAEEVLRNLRLLPPRPPQPQSHSPPQLRLAI
jgi:hypothetical protein